MDPRRHAISFSALDQGKPDLPEACKKLRATGWPGARARLGRAVPGAGSCWAPRRARLSRVRVYLGSDHAGFELKSALAEAVAAAGHEVTDCGPPSYHPGDDYPPYVMAAAAAAAADPGSIAIVVGGSGNGEQMASNKIRGIRAALAWSDETARLARQHNDANVLSLGARMHPVPDAVRFAMVFLETPFSGDPRHQRRIDEISDYEKSGVLPPRPDGATSG